MNHEQQLSILIFLTVCLIAPLVGALSGFILSLIMPEWIGTGLGIIGVKAPPDQFHKIGAALGFFGSFFRTIRAN